MLINLYINNVLLIDKCNIRFDQHLSVLTGETGAGKSIILDSLLFALGERASSKLIRQGETIASVTAEFSINYNEKVSEVINELAINIEDNLIIRRIITLDGKSKNYINDIPVSLTSIKKISELLIEIHSQHEQKFLLESATHLNIIDSYGRLDNEKLQVSNCYDEYVLAINHLSNLNQQITDALKDQEYFAYVVDELTKLNVQPNEEQELSDKRILLMNKEKLLEVINTALGELSSRNSPASIISNTQRTLTRNNNFSNLSFDTPIDLLEKVLIELEAATNQLENLLNSVEQEEELLEHVESRLFTLKAVARKYNIQIEQIPNYLAEIKQKLLLISNQEQDIAKAEQQVIILKKNYFEIAAKLSDNRKNASIRLEQELKNELLLLKMENTRFHVAIEPLASGELNRSGIDKITFLISPNPGLPLAPLTKVASGGELSRFMLAAKVVLAGISNVNTLIFDEIDTGLGGAVADAVGARLAALSKNTQVIAITHQPQIASKGNIHIHVAKNQNKESTNTVVKILNDAERVEEIARMLAGETVTDAARAAAKQLILT
jgi:DNA repair protein RecN (Recombination protein N)